MSQIISIPTSDIPSHLQKLVELRSVSYLEYPYFYEQNLEDEEEYVTQYANSDSTLLLIAKNAIETDGMAIGLALSAAQDWIQDAFKKYGEIDRIFYVGDIVTSQADQRLKTLLLDKLESILKQEKKFSKIAICEVYREEYPKENTETDQYWAAKGYQKHNDLRSVFWWKDLDKKEKTPKTLVYWIKQI